MLYHTIPPLYDGGSKILILGSFPSVKSRETQFYYGHRQNRFWRVISTVLDSETPVTTDDKKTLLLSHGIALWDVIASCDIEGSADSKIKNITVNDIGSVLSCAYIGAVFTNGSKATELYRRYVLPTTGIDCVPLPSTSPANAAFDMQKLVTTWSIILRYLGGNNK